MTLVSLLLNIVVLIPVTISLLRNAPSTVAPFGERTPARDILLAVYLAILIASIALLVWWIVTPGASGVVDAVATLLVVQVIYKLITALSVRRSLRNPVVIANLCIAAVHSVTLLVLWVGGR